MTRANIRTIACRPVAGARSKRSSRACSMALICSRTQASRAMSRRISSNMLGGIGVFFLERGDRHHFAVTRLAAQPSQKHADEHLSIEPIRLGSAGLARYCDTRRMHDEGLDATDPQPSSQPKSIATRLESENGPCDRSASFCRSIPPTLHQMQ